MRRLLEPIPGYARIRAQATAFLQWWGSELGALLPAVLRPDSRARRATLVLRAAGADLEYEIQDGEQLLALGELPRGARAGEALEVMLRGRVEPDRALLVLDDAQVLRLRLHLPRAAAEDPRAVLGFEMDKHTPFRADQVYFDFRLLGEGPAQTLALELLVVPRAVLDPLLERIERLRIGLERVDAGAPSGAGGQPRHAPMNLLPSDRRAAAAPRFGLVDRALGAAAAVLLVVAAVAPFVKLHMAEAALRAEVEAARAQAEEVLALREELSAGVAEVEAVMQRKLTEPPLIEVLGELAGILPDHTWLRTLTIDGETLRLEGESGAASALLGLIEASLLFEQTTFVSPVTRNPGSDSERFQISTRIADRS